MAAPTTPKLTVDIIIELVDRADRPIVLIRRRHPPEGWALPGGFVDVGETAERAAIREAREETGLDVQLKCLLGCYSDPTRDDRGHTASLVYIAEAHGEPVAGDDAGDSGVFKISEPPSLVFDHATMLADYRTWRANGQVPRPRT
jgi:8-oxo-dGTP diphosphatase